MALERDFSGGRGETGRMSQMISALERAKMGEMCGKLYFLENMPYACLLLKGHRGPHKTVYGWANQEDLEIS